MPTILLTLAQGVTTGAAGESILGTTGSAVTVGNDSAYSGQYKMEDVPEGSALSTGNLGGVGTTATFTPDVRGCYLVGLYTGTLLIAQLTFIVPELDGVTLLPPYGATGDMTDPTTGVVTKGNFRPTGALTRGWKGVTSLLRRVAKVPAALGAAYQVLRVNAGGTALEYVTPSAGGYTPPPKTGWSWYNQGGASVDESADPIVLIAPGGNHYNVHGRKRAFGATKTVVAAYSGLSALPIASGFPSFGIGWTDGTKLEAINCVGVMTNHGWMLEVHRYTDGVTLDSVQQAGFPPPFGEVLWVKLTDDGTNRKAWISSDEGGHWLQLWTAPRTTFLTATDHVLLVGEGGGASWGVHNTLRSWVDS